VAPIALALNESFMAIALAYANTDPVLASFHTSQLLIQAIPPRGSPLLQLPHFTAKVAQAIEGPAAKTHFSVQRFMRMPEDERRRLATAPGLLSDSQYQSAVAVARQIPVLQVEKVFFKVVGERFVTPNSLVQFVVKARVVPPGTAKLPEVSEAELDDPDPEEGDINALIGRASGGGGRGSSKKVKMATSAAALAEGKDGLPPQQPPLAFAPYFARDHAPRWHVFLADSKQGKIAVPPFTFASFDRPLFDAQGRATLAVQTLKMQFQAPPQAGRYTFVMHLVCDSYLDTDTKMEVTMMVEDMARAEEMAGEDEISEPDEGQLPFCFSFTVISAFNALLWRASILPPTHKKKFFECLLATAFC
jgi:translocation protein SEC63